MKAKLKLSPCEKARALGATIRSGINWDWAYFQSEVNARAFLAWLETFGFEHRGLHAPYQQTGCEQTGWSIRFR